MKYVTLFLLLITCTHMIQTSNSLEQKKAVWDNEYRDCCNNCECLLCTFLCCCNCCSCNCPDFCESSEICCPGTTKYDKRGTIDCNRLCIIGDCISCCKSADNFMTEHCNVQYKRHYKHSEIPPEITTYSYKKYKEPCSVACRDVDCSGTLCCAKVTTIISLACCCTSLLELKENLNDPADYQTEDNSLVTSSNTPKSTSQNNVTPAREMDNLYSTPKTTSLNNIIAVKTMDNT